MYISSYINFYI